MLSGAKVPDRSLASASHAKSQAAALWAVIEKGEQVQPLAYPGHTLEAYGKIKLHKDAVEEVIDLVAELAGPSKDEQASSPFMGDADIAQAAKASAYGTKSSDGMPKEPYYGTKASVLGNTTGSATVMSSDAKEKAKESKYGTKTSVFSAVAPLPAGPTNDSEQSTLDSVQQSSEKPYESKAALVAKENAYGTKVSVTQGTPVENAAPSSTNPYGPKPKRESIYGTTGDVKAAPMLDATNATLITISEGDTPIAAPVAEPSGDNTEYGSRVATVEAAMNAMAGKKTTEVSTPLAAVDTAARKIVVENEYQYTQFKSKSESAIPATIQGATAEAAAAARPSVSQVSLTPEQIIAMVNQMTVQQQQQAYMMLKLAVSKGHPLSPQQQQLLNALQDKYQNIPNQSQDGEIGQTQGADGPTETSGVGSLPGVNQVSDRKGLFFVLPKKQKFQFGIPGREIITLRHFERVSQKKNAQNEKVLMVICNDVAFICKPSQAETAGKYELYDKPTQRDKVTASDSKDERCFILKLGKESHTLIANSREEKLYWVQLINSRANFVPTTQLANLAAEKKSAVKAQ